jgi:protein tyrosine/serine phosphatase
MMDLFQIDDASRLFISPIIEDWKLLHDRGIETIIDLEGGLDVGVPTVPNQCLYIYFPIIDDDLPDLTKLRAISRLGASLVEAGHPVLAHCGMGFNRSALVAGLILCELGFSGPDAVARIRQRRPGALYNECFAEYLASLPGK